MITAADHDEQSLAESFAECEKVVTDMEGGSVSAKDIQERLCSSISTLESLTMSVSKLGLFSSNESWEELPNGSLSFLLIPCFLGYFHQNKMQSNPAKKIDELKIAKIYFRDFLKRLRDYSVIEFKLTWEKAEEGETNKNQDAEMKRMEKISRFRNQKEQQDIIDRIHRLKEMKSEDDSDMRDMIVAQLRFWALRVVSELESIDNEVPMLEYMMKRQEGDVKEETPVVRGPSRKPFIITRDAAQKAVYGLGYPSIPVMSVDEWYEDREKKGLFGPNGPGGSGMSVPAEGRLSDSENEDDEREDERRAKVERWDEYKDSHRRGWGNMHNKG